MRNIKPSFTIPNCFLAGGAVLSLVTKKPINDYDIYPKNEEGLLCAIDEFMSRGFCINISDKAITFVMNDENDVEGHRRMAQVIIGAYFPTAASIFKKFDFTVCMGAYDFDTKEYSFGDDMLFDVASKSLRFNVDTNYPLASFVRIKKYMSKGFTISKAELVKMALTASKSGMPNSWKELESAIGGVYGRNICLSKDETGEEIPFSYELAIDRLSNIDESNLELSTLQIPEEFSSLTVDEIVTMVTHKDSIRVVNIQDKYYTLVEDDGLYTIGDKINKKLIDFYASKNVKIDVYNGPLFGYKVLDADEQGNLYPGIRGKSNSNGITYTLGHATSYEKSPYLFVFTDKTSANNQMPSFSSTVHKPYIKKLFRVMFNSGDIKIADIGKQIQVTKMILTEQIEHVVKKSILDIL